MEKIIQASLTFIPLIAIVGLFVFTQRSTSKKQRQYKEMIESISINDEVTTKGGIIGTVIKVEDKDIIIQSGPDKNRIKILKDGIEYLVKHEGVEVNKKVSDNKEVTEEN